jgi:prevent-host-death family protein
MHQDRHERLHRVAPVARTHLAELITSAESGTPTVITRNGTPAAVLVPMADYQALEDAADIILAREAAAVLREEGEGRHRWGLWSGPSPERGKGGADLVGRAPVVIELGDHGEVLSQLDNRHAGSPVAIEGG